MLTCFIPQNSKYTFKQNITNGRHGWLRLTPAYSVQLVNEIIDNLPYTPQCILDPFSGTGTTELVCAYKGINAFALEINPFLVWFAKAKLSIYPNEKIDNFIKYSHIIINDIENFSPYPLPPIYNIERWWTSSNALFLAKLKSGIKRVKDIEESTLLHVAFCKIVIELSNAAFNHVSTSFKSSNGKELSKETIKKFFLNICKSIGESARHQPLIQSDVFLSDAKQIDRKFAYKFDTVITSPPYPNRISYIRELRPYMYWLDYLHTSKDASELDWRTIGGTWGKATSLLSMWEKKHELPSHVYNITNQVHLSKNKSSHLMANYILKYFDDMYEHFYSVFNSLVSKGRIYYIIGNSNFYGVTVPIEEIITEILNSIGYISISNTIIRKRNCKKQLYEYLISAQKP